MKFVGKLFFIVILFYTNYAYASCSDYLHGFSLIKKSKSIFIGNIIETKTLKDGEFKHLFKFKIKENIYNADKDYIDIHARSLIADISYIPEPSQTEYLVFTLHGTDKKDVFNPCQKRMIDVES